MILRLFLIHVNTIGKNINSTIAAAINRIVPHFDCYRKCKQSNQQDEQFFWILVKDISQSRGNWIRVRINMGWPKGSA